MRSAAVVCALLVSATLLARADDWNKSFPVSGRASLWVRTNDASVSIAGSDRSDISAHVETDGWRISDDQVKVTARQNGNRVEVEVHIPHPFGWHVRPRRVHVDLSVPRESDVDVNTADGRLEARGVSGDLHLATEDGGIEASDIAGSVQAHTSDGNMDIDQAKCDCRLDTSDGRITARELDGKLRGGSSDGSIEVDGRFDVLELHTNDGHVTAEARRGSAMSADWALTSSDGSITLRVPTDFSAELDAQASDGSVHVDFPVTVQGKVTGSIVAGRINQGGYRLRLKTSDGSIRVERS
jgi:DUF4097 and DUF4098 domain-containing protein YvlB